MGAKFEWEFSDTCTHFIHHILLIYSANPSSVIMNLDFLHGNSEMENFKDFRQAKKNRKMFIVSPWWLAKVCH